MGALSLDPVGLVKRSRPNWVFFLTKDRAKGSLDWVWQRYSIKMHGSSPNNLGANQVQNYLARSISNDQKSLNIGIWDLFRIE